MKIKVENIYEIDDQRIVDAFNKLNKSTVTISELNDDMIIDTIQNTDDIMVDLLGEDFEGGYIITLMD